ncbi:hypothetical protein CPAR01_08632 [Colletotrichum paranaense]|uniref:Secreted protein n=2 Tax=Colletotrichum acutatum species complex TaxID=2707335 RepID=A0ABQ9SKT7_9PEZI|nr:uncharacterized protein CPAR01_08632 [Colletotrichum paranaense]KAK1538519.1 hypothetical protein CPAR01_08632 [Colletotrichum paranaense]
MVVPRGGLFSWHLAGRRMAGVVFRLVPSLLPAAPLSRADYRASMQRPRSTRDLPGIGVVGCRGGWSLQARQVAKGNQPRPGRVTSWSAARRTGERRILRTQSR